MANGGFMMTVQGPYDSISLFEGQRDYAEGFGRRRLGSEGEYVHGGRLACLRCLP